MQPKHSERCRLSTGYTHGCPYDADPAHMEGHKPHRPYSWRDAVAYAVFLAAGSIVLWAVAGFPGARP
jgi:hypothetical protein